MVECKTSARWDTEGRVTRRAPAVITEALAGFANSKGDPVLYERLPNSTPAIPKDQIDALPRRPLRVDNP